MRLLSRTEVLYEELAKRVSVSKTADGTSNTSIILLILE